MNKFKIVLFKADCEDDDEYLQLFKSNQLNAYCLSPVKFEFKNLDHLADKLNNDFHSNYSSLVISSPRVLQVLKNLIQDNKLTLDCVQQLPCLTVGPQTFKKLNDDFQNTSLIDNIVHNINNGKDLALYLNGHLDELAEKTNLSRPFLYPTSNLSKDELRTYLNDAIEIEKLVCYETLPNAELDNDLDNLFKSIYTSTDRSNIVSITDCSSSNATSATESSDTPAAYNHEDIEREFMFVFFSPSGFTNFKENVKCIRTNRLKLIAIGPTTKKSIEDSNYNLIATSTKPTPESLLETIQKCISNFVKSDYQ